MRHRPRLVLSISALMLLAALAGCSPEPAPSSVIGPTETVEALPSAVATTVVTVGASAMQTASPATSRLYWVLMLNLVKHVSDSQCHVSPSSCYLYLPMYPPSPCGQSILPGQTVTCAYAIPANATVTIEFKGTPQKVYFREGQLVARALELPAEVFTFTMTGDRTFDVEMF